MSRGWTWIDDTERTDEEYERTSLICDELAQEWSALHDEIEHEGFRRQAMYEDGDDPADHFETEEELKAWERQDSARREVKRVRLDVLEGMLEKYGARMMRPYEHWNEDERYMQYMECDRFGDSCD